MKSACLPSVFAYLWSSIYICPGFYLANADLFWPLKVSDWRRCAKSDNAIRTFWDVSVVVCVDLCNRRTSCKAVNFDRTIQQCELLRTDHHNDTDNKRRSCVFIKMSDVHTDEEVPDQCQDCLPRQVCELPQGDCVYRECDKLNVSHAVVKGNMNNVGATVKIAPDTGYTLGSQSPKSVCTSNGTWNNIPDLMVSCDDGWQYIEVTESCYQAFVQPMQYIPATDHCLSFDAHVVQFENKTESDAVKSFLSEAFDVTRYKEWWVGIELVGEHWVYTGSNTTASFTDWAPNEPNGYGEEPCVELRFDMAGWNDLSCTRAKRPICEKSLL